MLSTETYPFDDFEKPVTRWAIIRNVENSIIGYRAIVSIAEDGELGYTVCNPSPMGEANANLIATSPQLLATLEKVAAYWAGGDVPADLHAEMLAVIRQAKGEA